MSNLMTIIIISERTNFPSLYLWTISFRKTSNHKTFKNMKRILLFVILCIGLNSFAQTTWTGAGANSNWNNIANWNTNLVPTASDDVIIPDGSSVIVNVSSFVKSIVVQGTSTITINQNFSFTNASSFSANTIVNWNNNSLYGGGTLTNNGTVNLTTSGSRYVSGGTTIINNGLFTMPAAGYFYLYDTSIFNNTSNGTFDIQSDAILSYSGTLHNFTNAGLLKKSTTSGSAQIQCILTNTGNISVESGTLSLTALPKTFNSGIYNVTNGGELTLNALTNINGTLTGTLNGALNWSSDLSVSGSATFNFTGANAVNWNNSSLLGGGNLTNESTIILTTGGSRYISGNTTLTNKSLVTMPANGYLYLYDTSVFNNTSTGIFDFQSDAVLSYSGTAHQFNNTGLIKKSITAGSAQIQCILINTGTINVESGTLSMNSLTKTFDGGIYNISNGSGLSLNILTNINGTLTGVLNGVFNWNSNISVSGAATLNFTGTNAVNWNNSSLLGGGNLTNESPIILATAGSRYISGNTTLTNKSLVTMPANGYLYIIDTSVFNNTSSGTFDIQSDAILSYSGGGAHQFNNAGLLKRTTTTGNAQILCYLTNTGTISVESGTLSLTALPKTFDGGIYNVATTSEFILGILINVSNTLTGLLNGPMTWANNISVPTTAAFNFTGTTGVNWPSGSLLGGGTLTNQSTINLTTAGSRYISGTITTLANSGLIKAANGGYLYLYNDASINNLATGVIDFQSDCILSYSGGGNFSIINDGLIKKSAGIGSTTIYPPVTNSGTIDASSGTILFVDGKNFINTNTGIIKGTATIDLPTDAHFTNNGTFSPGNSPGILTVLGKYKSTATSKLKIELNGLTQGTDYDLLAITGNDAIFSGNVDVTMGFDGAIGNQFTIATTSGTIATANLTSPITNVDYNGFRYTFDVSYPANKAVMLTTTNKLDIMPPNVITKNITVQLNASGNATITPMQVENGSTDNHSLVANLTYSLDKSSFTCANLGANTVMLKVTDEAGNFASAPAIVTVEDMISPTITCPSDFTISTSGSYTLPNYFANNTVTDADNCSVTSETQTPSAGTILAHGNHTISFKISDSSGNTTSCSFILTVQDITLNTVDVEFSDKNILIYPNPVVDILTLKNLSNEKLLSLEIFDASGKMVNKFDLSKMEKTKNISFENYPSGIYLMKIYTSQSSITKKIIKK